MGGQAVGRVMVILGMDNVLSYEAYQEKTGDESSRPEDPVHYDGISDKVATFTTWWIPWASVDQFELLFPGGVDAVIIVADMKGGKVHEYETFELLQKTLALKPLARYQIEWRNAEPVTDDLEGSLLWHLEFITNARMRKFIESTNAHIIQDIAERPCTRRFELPKNKNQ